ncbi:MAG: DNA methyltransferase [Bdellovibrionota bacterium]
MSYRHGDAPYYRRGELQIIHGDSLEVLPSLPAESFDFLLTDPPYPDYLGRWDGDRKTIVGDDDDRWVRPIFSELYRVLKDDALAVTFYGWPHADVFVGTFKEAGFRLVSHLAFVKNVWGLGRFTRGQHETAFLLAKGRPAMPKCGISDVFEWTRELDAAHPNQKPLAAMKTILATYAPEKASVLDPFLGSGTTLRAAKDLGMSGVGIEVEKRWCEVAAMRMAQEVLFV